MPINRFNRPAQQGLMNTYTPLPYQELMQGLGAKERQQELGIAGVGKYGDQEFQYLQADRAQAAQAQDWLDTESDRLAGIDLTTPEGKKSLRDFERQGKKLFGQEGAVGAMQSNYNAYQAAIKRERERLKKGDITQDAFQKTMSGLLDAYEGIGENGIEGYNAIGIEDIAKTVNFTDWANKYGKDFEATLNERAYAKTDGQYIRDGKSANEVLSPQEISEVLNLYAAGDDELKNYLAQGTKYGYSSEEALMAAITGSANKFDVNKHTETAGMKTDAYGLHDYKQEPQIGANDFLTTTTPLFDLGVSEEDIASMEGNEHLSSDDAVAQVWEGKTSGNRTALEETNKTLTALQAANFRPGTAEYNENVEKIENAQNNIQYLKEEIDFYDALEEQWYNEAVAQVESGELDITFTSKAGLSSDESFVINDGTSGLNLTGGSQEMDQAINKYISKKEKEYLTQRSRDYGATMVNDKMRAKGTGFNTLQEAIKNNPNSFSFKGMTEGSFAKNLSGGDLDLKDAKLTTFGTSDDGAWVRLRVPTAKAITSDYTKTKGEDGDTTTGSDARITSSATTYEEYYVAGKDISNIIYKQLASTAKGDRNSQAHKLSLPYSPRYRNLNTKLQSSVSELPNIGSKTLSLGEASFPTGNGTVSKVRINRDNTVWSVDYMDKNGNIIDNKGYNSGSGAVDNIIQTSDDFNYLSNKK